MRRIKKFLAAFLNAHAAVTAMTALGLIAAILYATPAPTPAGVVNVCLVIAALGFVVIVYQWRQGYARLTDEEQRFAVAQRIFRELRPDWKRALKEMTRTATIRQTAVPDWNDFRECPLVLDVGIGRLRVEPLFAAVLPRVIQEWEAEQEGKAAQRKGTPPAAAPPSA